MKKFFIPLLCLFCFTTLFGADLSFPKHTPFVTDEAGLLDASTKNKLNQILSQNTKYQLEVAVLKSSRGLDVAQYGYQLGRHWGVGDKNTDNGVLFIIIPSQHDLRIETGYGAEAALTDAQARLILENEVVPYFKQDQMVAGIINGATKLTNLLENAEAPLGMPSGTSNHPYPLASAIIVFLFIGIFVFIVASKLNKKGFGESFVSSGSRSSESRSRRSSYSSPSYRSSSSSRSSSFRSRPSGGRFGGGGASSKW